MIGLILSSKYFRQGSTTSFEIFFIDSTYVENLVFLFHKSPDSIINVKVEFGEGEGKVPLDVIPEWAKKY